MPTELWSSSLTPDDVFRFIGAQGNRGAHPEQMARHFRCTEEDLVAPLQVLLAQGWIVSTALALPGGEDVRYDLSFKGRKRMTAGS